MFEGYLAVGPYRIEIGRVRRSNLTEQARFVGLGAGSWKFTQFRSNRTFNRENLFVSRVF